jgi:hypothetical protein
MNFLHEMSELDVKSSFYTITFLHIVVSAIQLLSSIALNNPQHIRAISKHLALNLK